MPPQNKNCGGQRSYEFNGGLSAGRTTISMGREPWADKNDGCEMELMAISQLQRRSEASRRGRSIGGVNLAATIHGALGAPAAQLSFRTLHSGCMMVAHHVAVVHHVVLAVACRALVHRFAGGRPQRRKPRANKGCNDRNGEYPPHSKTLHYIA